MNSENLALDTSIISAINMSGRESNQSYDLSSPQAEASTMDGRNGNQDNCCMTNRFDPTKERG